MFCTNCGSKINDGNMFCPNCGAKSGNAGPNESVQMVAGKKSAMLLLNIDYIPDKKIEVLGMVKGNSAQSKNIGKDLMAGLKNMIGGEVSDYREMTMAARQAAINNMQEEASAMNADAIINIRFGSASMAVQGVVEVVAYGTAVRVIE